MRAISEAPILILGYGNTLRCDDGVGARVAQTIADLNLPGIESDPCPQLTPELADPISRAQLVIFVDATVDPVQEVQCRSLAPAHSSQVLAHHVDPGTLLALARDLFGAAPPAWLLTIPIESTDVGDELSPIARRGCSSAIKTILSLARTIALLPG